MDETDFVKVKLDVVQVWEKLSDELGVRIQSDMQRGNSISPQFLSQSSLNHHVYELLSYQVFSDMNRKNISVVVETGD